MTLNFENPISSFILSLKRIHLFFALSSTWHKSKEASGRFRKPVIQLELIKWCPSVKPTEMFTFFKYKRMVDERSSVTMEQEHKWPWGKLAGEGKGKREKNQVKLRENVCRLVLSLAVVVVVEFLSHVWFFVTPWTAAHQALLSSTISRSLLKLMSIESVMPSNPSQPLSSPSLPAFNLSQHQGLF